VKSDPARNVPGTTEKEGEMKVHALQTMFQFMRMLPDEALDNVADARFWHEPRDYMDKVILQLAAGEREWRKECQVS